MVVNANDFHRALENVSPDYFGTTDLWSVFSDNEKRSIRLSSKDAVLDRKRFTSALRSPCCTKWRISHATAGTLSITLTGPESGMEIIYSVVLAPSSYVSETTRWEICGLLRDYPKGMIDRTRLSDAVAVLLGIVKIRPKDVAR